MGNETRRQFEMPAEAEVFCEVFLVVRPEDKTAVSRVFEAELGGRYMSQAVLGRGFHGGLSYGSQLSKSALKRWIHRQPVLGFHPKIAFLAVLEKSHAEDLLEKLSLVIKRNGQPLQCASGFAVISKIDQQSQFGTVVEDSPTPAPEHAPSACHSYAEAVLV
jgi:hypothetical protein